MKIAVTGASGFIGEEVLEVLAQTEHEVIGLSRQARQGQGKLIWKATDYCVDSLKEVLEGVDAVIHLAAIRGTSGCYADYHDNEVMTENLLLAMGACGVKKIVFASSIAVYSDLSMMPWKENMMLTPKTLYGITKAACEHLCMFYSRKYDFQYAIARIAQVLGGGERRRVMTNVFMEQASKKEQIHVMGKSTARRQYIYSRDLARVLVALTGDQYKAEIVNVGMEQACTNLEIAQLTNEVYGSDVPIDYDDSKPEVIEPSIMSTEHYHQILSLPCLSMKEALADIASR